MSMLMMKHFRFQDQDDVRQLTQLNILEGKKYPWLAAMARHKEFLQHTQGKAKVSTGLDGLNISRGKTHFFINELEIDIIYLYDKRTVATDYRKNQVRLVVDNLSKGWSQKKIKEITGIGQSIVSGIVKEIRQLLIDDEERLNRKA